MLTKLAADILSMGEGTKQYFFGFLLTLKATFAVIALPVIQLCSFYCNNWNFKAGWMCCRAKIGSEISLMTSSN